MENVCWTLCYFFKLFYSSMVDLQNYVNFCCVIKWFSFFFFFFFVIQFYIHAFLFIFFSQDSECSFLFCTGGPCFHLMNTFYLFFKFKFIYFNWRLITLLFFKYLLIYLAAPGLSCSMWDLVPWPGIKPGPPALGAESLNHRTSREVP